MQNSIFKKWIYFAEQDLNYFLEYYEPVLMNSAGEIILIPSLG